MDTVWQDLRYSLRLLIKSPGFTIISILTLALGIGANTAIFSVVNAILLRPLPYPEPDRLIKVWETFPPSGQGSVSAPNLKDWREQNQVFENLAGYVFTNYNLQGKDSPARVPAAAVTANFFATVGVKPIMGRVFADGEDQPGADHVVVLSEKLWRRDFAADPDIINRRISVSGESYTVIGVMSSKFEFPSRRVELWAPITMSPAQRAARGSHFLLVLGRLKSGATLDQAREQMVVIARRLGQQYPDAQNGRSVLLVPLKEELVQGIRPALKVLLGAVGFVLLIACVNVANLLLARANSRRREIAIRAALGAGRSRLIRQFLTESLLLATLGGTAGVFLGKLGLDLLLGLGATFLPRANEIALDGKVLGFTLLLTILTGIGFGLAPALQVAKPDVQSSMKDGGTSPVTGAGRSLVRNILAVTEIAAALVLLVGAGLLMKSFIGLQRIDTGLQQENVLTMRVTLPEAKYDTLQARTSLYERVLERVGSIPGVLGAGVINLLPLQDWGTNGGFQIEGHPPFPRDKEPLAEYRAVSRDYFSALGIPLVRGRYFADQDAQKSTRSVIINRILADRYFPGEDALGKGLLLDGPAPFTIVGIVGDVKQSGLTRPPMPELFIPYHQVSWPFLTQEMTLVVRASANPTALNNAVRQAVTAVDPAQPVYNVQTMTEVISTSFSYNRAIALLLGVFAGVAVVLAIIGIYGVISSGVNQRTHELGVRIALGAQSSDIFKLILGQGTILALIGVAVGLSAALAVTRMMESLLYGVSAKDPVTFAAISVLLVGVALIASFVPARRATKVDPMLVLRGE